MLVLGMVFVRNTAAICLAPVDQLESTQCKLYSNHTCQEISVFLLTF